MRNVRKGADEAILSNELQSGMFFYGFLSNQQRVGGSLTVDVGVKLSFRKYRLDAINCRHCVACERNSSLFRDSLGLLQTLICC